MAKRPLSTAVLAAFLLSGCQSSVYEVYELLEPEEVTSRNIAPPGAAPGTCWGRDATPAVIETVTEQVMLRPAEIMSDGSVSKPAIYQTETQQQIVTPREDAWFETPCDDTLTPDFTANVQRALKARGHYRGAINGKMDGRTRAAIRAYQKPQGLDSGMLSLAAARQMGLLQVDLDDAGITTSSLPNDVAVAALDEAGVTVDPAPVTETAAAQAARLAEDQAAQREADKIEQARLEKEQAEREAEAKRLAEAESAIRAEEEAHAAEAARIAEAERKVREASAAEQARAEAAEREKNKRAKELVQALEDEKARTGGTTFEPLPISNESY